MQTRILSLYPATQETHEGLVRASRWAIGNNHDCLCAGHVLLGLANVKRSVAGHILQQAQITPQEIIEALADLVDLFLEAKSPDEDEYALTGTTSHEPDYPLPSVISVLKTADQYAAQDSYPCVSTGHVLLAILEKTPTLQLLVDENMHPARDTLILGTRTLLSTLPPPRLYFGNDRFREFPLLSSTP